MERNAREQRAYWKAKADLYWLCFERIQTGRQKINFILKALQIVELFLSLAKTKPRICWN
jgi:hypothetical protein